MRAFPYLLFLLFLVATTDGSAQGFITTEYLSASSFKDEAGNKLGAGDLMKVSGQYTFPLSLKENEAGQPIMWSASVGGTYAVLNNENMTLDVSPDKVLNAGFNLNHVRPLSKRWYLIASLGGGVYSAPDAITWKSILVNGGVIFVYKCRQNLDIGIGAGVTNSFGIPIVMPMIFVNWQLAGNYEVGVNLSSGMKISAAVRFGGRFKLRLVALEMDGISSVVDVDGQSMIYGSAMIRSYLCPEYKISRKTSLYVGVGGNWLRSAKLTNRTLKAFAKSFSTDEKEPNFYPAVYLTAGIRY